MLHISLRGVNGRLWCSHSVFTGHSACSGLSTLFLHVKLVLEVDVYKSKNRDPFPESFKHMYFGRKFIACNFWFTMPVFVMSCSKSFLYTLSSV